MVNLNVKVKVTMKNLCCLGEGWFWLLNVVGGVDCDAAVVAEFFREAGGEG